MSFSAKQLNVSVVYCHTAPELYCYLLSVLDRCNKNIAIDETIQQLKNYFINHQPLNKENLLKKIRRLENILEQELIDKLQCVIASACQDPTAQERFNNLFHREFESLLATQLFLRPTDNMMKATSTISLRIIAILEKNKEKYKELIKNFLQFCSLSSNEPEVFGKIDKEEITIEYLYDILNGNEKKHFIQIMLIQYAFARVLYREFENVTSGYPGKTLPGVLENYLKSTCSDLSLDNVDNLPEKIRRGFIDGVLRGSSFFRDVKETRGRGKFIESIFSPKTGILLAKQPYQYLPTLPEISAWNPDVLCQEPCFSSSHVQSVLSHDLVYVSGPSGMTTLLLGMMELFACAPNQDFKENYLLCIACYIVSGGLHAFHEVLYIAHDLLNYFPNYQLGNYQVIFDHFSQDHQFKLVIDQVWNLFSQFCKSQFHRITLQRELKLAFNEYNESSIAKAIQLRSQQFNSVGKISNCISDLLIKNYQISLDELNTNPFISKELYDPIYFGCLFNQPSSNQGILDNILVLLREKNTPLEQVIHIHSIIARHMFHVFSFNTHKHFLPNDRGRKTKNNNPKPSHRLGIAHSLFNTKIGNSPNAHRCGIDEFSPDFNSPFYQSTIKHNLPFVSGLSGHTYKLLKGAKLYTNLTDDEFKEYTFACFAYLTLGGNHSFHEVMSVAKLFGVIYQEGDYSDILNEVGKNHPIFTEELAQHRHGSLYK